MESLGQAACRVTASELTLDAKLMVLGFLSDLEDHMTMLVLPYKLELAYQWQVDYDAISSRE